MAKGSPSAWLRKVDLPTFVRPMRVTVPNRMVGGRIHAPQNAREQIAGPNFAQWAQFPRFFLKK
jgi:hypothetical protein